jgi:xanthine dehydrogenase molybdenum-binding subunit
MTTYYGLEKDEAYKPWLWPVPENGVIGKRGLRRLDGPEKASGRAVYTRDVTRPGMLFAKMLTSPYAHAKIKSMNTAKAEALPGVRAILRYDDPDIAKETYTLGVMVIKRQYDLLASTAHWYGQMVGALVCADTEQIVDQALKLIEIEWEELPFIIDWNEALKPDAPLLRPDLNSSNNLYSEWIEEHGNVDEGFAEADTIIEFEENGEEDVWAGVESFSCIAEWKGENLDLWVHGNSPTITAPFITKYLPQNKLHLNTLYRGGTFGGVSTSCVDVALDRLAVLAAKRTNRPVKVFLDNSHFHVSGEHGGTYKFKVGFKKDGTITAVKLETIWCAWTGVDQITKLHEGTKIPNLYALKRYPYLNRGQPTCYRHGAPAASVITMIYEHVAGELKMDPTKVAEINDGCEGEEMSWIVEKVKKVQGFDPTRDSLKEVLEVGKKAIDWDNKWHLPGTKILPNGNYHGIGFTWCIGWETAPRGSTVGLYVGADGTVEITGMISDIGVNAFTTYSQVIASELGVPYQNVVLRNLHNVGLSFNPPGGSAGMAGNNPTLVRVAQKMKKMLLEYAVRPRMPAAFFPNKTPAELDIKNGEVYEIAHPENKITMAQLANGFNTGSPFTFPRSDTPFFVVDCPPRLADKTYIMARLCYFMEVEVNPDTGYTDVKKVVVVNDAGRVVNPDSVNGQQYGGFYMGLGRSRDEQVYYDQQTGVKLNDNLIGYPVLLMNDCGPIEPYLVENTLGYNPYGACGVSECTAAVPATLTGPAIYNAIGKYVDDFPTTPDKVLKALGKI